MSWRLEGGLLEGDPAELLESLLARLPTGSLSGAVGGGAIAKVIVDQPSSSGTYDYLVPDEMASDLTVGSLVRVPLRGRRTRGWVVGFADSSAFASVRPISARLGGMPIFGRAELALARWVSGYYIGPLYQVLRHFQPPTLPPPQPRGSIWPGAGVLDRTRSRVELIEHAPAVPPVEVLAARVAEARERGETAILVLPTLAGTLSEELRRLFPGSVIIDSRQSSARRTRAWVRAATSPSLIIGGRAAVFAPAGRLGFIGVLDDGNPALKEESAPCYDSREVAIVRGRLSGARVAICGAAPSPEARAWATRATGPAGAEVHSAWPALEIAYRGDDPPGPGALGSTAVARSRSVLRQGGRVLFFINRVGESRCLVCKGCLRVRRCALCEGALMRDGSAGSFTCSRCKAAAPLPCPDCSSTKTRRLGIGTRGLVSESERLFPDVSISRADRESGERASDASIVVGTEAAFWRAGGVDLVVFVDLDSMLLQPDAFAAESTFRLIARAGSLLPQRRFARFNPGLILQTYIKRSAVASAAVAGSAEKLMRHELGAREESSLPPFSRTALVTLTGDDSGRRATEMFSSLVAAGCSVLGPDRIRSGMRLLVLSTRPPEDWPLVASAAAEARKGRCRVRIEVDPARLT